MLYIILVDSKKHEFDALFDNAAIGIIIVNNQGRILLINEFALKEFGYNAAELEGEKIEILIPRRFKEKHEHHRDHYHQHNPHSRPMGSGMDLFAMRKDGSEFPVEVSLSTYKTTEGQFSIAFVSNITIRKKSEAELVELNTELEQKVKERTQSLQEALQKEKALNELKTRFVSMASHEFRTPLSTILSSVYLVSKYEESEDKIKKERHIQRIISSVNLLSDILNDFLSVGKIEEGKIQVKILPVDIAETVNSFIVELSPILKTNQNINYTHSGAEMIATDHTLLHHIIINLISNAIKFSQDNANIWIETTVTNNIFYLQIRDEGIGISSEDQKYLFQRFFRGANVSNIQGTGLGLHIVAKYVELLNGTITCTSELGEGSTFSLMFNLNP